VAAGLGAGGALPASARGTPSRGRGRERLNRATKGRRLVAGRGKRQHTIALVALAAGEIQVRIEIARLARDDLAPQNETVGVEQAAQIGICKQPRSRRVTCLLEASQLERGQRIGRRKLIDDENRSTGAGDANELGDQKLRPVRVVQRSQRPSKVERE
jgi:hypothetical protein